MDIPYSRSGASSRAHYAVVLKFENASTEKLAEEYLAEEVERIRRRFSNKALSNVDLQNDLIILLYCLNNSLGSVTRSRIAFALPFAVHLAEAGRNGVEKGLGYMFCSQVMPPEHELVVMLVNTVQKDLKSYSIRRICLALNALIEAPSTYVVPAVQPRLFELLSHPSPRVKILTLHAYRSLARSAPSLIQDASVLETLKKRLMDAELAVVRAALRLGENIAKEGSIDKAELITPAITVVTRFLDNLSTKHTPAALCVMVLHIIRSLFHDYDLMSNIGNIHQFCRLILSSLHHAIRSNMQALILELFRILGQFPYSLLFKYISGSVSPSATESMSTPQKAIHPVISIRHYLSSRSLNDHYFFLSCICCLDPTLWAGSQVPLYDTKKEVDATGLSKSSISIPAVLDQWEVERVIGFLESEDSGIRLLTIQVLISLDLSLVDSCYEHALVIWRDVVSGDNFHSEDKIRILQKLFELLVAVTLKRKGEEPGLSFAQKLNQIASVSPTNGSVDRDIVGVMLNYIRLDNASIILQCITGLLLFVEGQLQYEYSDRSQAFPTLLLVLLALCCEKAYCLNPCPLSAQQIVSRLARFLSRIPQTMQEPVILCMTRLLAVLGDSELASSDIVESSFQVSQLREKVNRNIKTNAAAAIEKSCNSFLEFCSNPSYLRAFFTRKADISLPEFAILLNQRASDPSPKPLEQSRTERVPRHSPSSSQNKLRYAAYVPSSANSMHKTLQRSSRDFGSESFRDSMHGPSEISHDVEEGAFENPDSSRTISAGELALTADSLPKVAQDSVMPNIDLLSINSPFLAEPVVEGLPSPYVSASTSLRNSPEPDHREVFETLWHVFETGTKAVNARGWYEETVEHAVRLLQGLGIKMDVVPVDDFPFEGDLKVLLRDIDSSEFDHPDTSCTLLRLHEEGDGSCLWQMRSNDNAVVNKVKEALR